MFGLGKPRSAFGKYLDREGLSQSEVAAAADISEELVSRYCKPDGPKPTAKTCSRLNKGLAKLGRNINVARFFR